MAPQWRAARVLAEDPQEPGESDWRITPNMKRDRKRYDSRNNRVRKHSGEPPPVISNEEWLRMNAEADRRMRAEARAWEAAGGMAQDPEWKRLNDEAERRM